VHQRDATIETRAVCTIRDIRAALADNRITASDFLRHRWRKLRQLNEQGRDPAWISLATEPQLEAQLASLGQYDPMQFRSTECPLQSRTISMSPAGRRPRPA